MIIDRKYRQQENVFVKRGAWLLFLWASNIKNTTNYVGPVQDLAMIWLKNCSLDIIQQPLTQ